MEESRMSAETDVDGFCWSLFINPVSKKSFDQLAHVIFVFDLYEWSLWDPYEFKMSYYLYIAI